MYFLLVYFMIFSPSLEANVVISAPPNVEVPTISNPFPFYHGNNSTGNIKDIEEYLKWLDKKTPARIHLPLALKHSRAHVKKIEPTKKSDQMKKIVSVCTRAFANTKDNAVARVFDCILQGFDKS